MRFKQKYHPQIEKAEEEILRGQTSRWLIEAPTGPRELGTARLRDGQLEAEWYCPQYLPVICVILKVLPGERWRDNLVELGVLIILLELGIWAEERVVVVKRDYEPHWDETEIFLRDSNIKTNESRCSSSELSYEEELRSRERALDALIPFEVAKPKTRFEPRDRYFVHEASRYDCLASLISTTIGKTSKMLIPREWTVSGDKMHHVTGFDVQPPSHIPESFQVRAEIPEPNNQKKQRRLFATLRLCSQRESVLDFDRPYQPLIKVFDDVENSFYFNKPTDWAMCCKHMEGWLEYYRTVVKQK